MGVEVTYEAINEEIFPWGWVQPDEGLKGKNESLTATF